jgi:hypothetical protein
MYPFLIVEEKENDGRVVASSGMGAPPSTEMNVIEPTVPDSNALKPIPSNEVPPATDTVNEVVGSVKQLTNPVPV